MKQLLIAVAVLSIVIPGCTGNAHNPEQVQPPGNTTQKTDTFFPVTSFIKGQILMLDSLPVTTLYTTTIKEKTDSAWLKKEDLKPLLQTFTIPEITETNFNRLFKETKFNDQTINAVTFTYDPVTALPDSVSLQHWTVYVDPATGKVTGVYIVKRLRERDNIFTQQLTWQTGKWAKINTILNKADGNSELLKEEKLIWDFNDPD